MYRFFSSSDANVLEIQGFHQDTGTRSCDYAYLHVITRSGMSLSAVLEFAELNERNSNLQSELGKKRKVYITCVI